MKLNNTEQEIKVEILVAAMVPNPKNLLNSMNIQSDIFIANQTDNLSYVDFKTEFGNVKIFNTKEKGVGKNRNLALDRATGDICILADDDQTFYNDYKNTIIETYKKYPNADVIVFNIDSNNSIRKKIKKNHRVTWFNYMRYGATRISFKRKSVTKNGIHFNVHFGGGADYSAGEDVLFLTECLRKKLKIIAVDITLASLDENSESTWFQGYNNKFFEDRGILYGTISNKWSNLLILFSAFIHYRIYKNDISFYNAYTSMKSGIKKYRNNDIPS